MNLQEFTIQSLLLKQKRPGTLIPEVIGSDSLGNVVARPLWMSTVTPPLPIDYTVQLWFNYETFAFYKSSNWRDTSNWVWEPVTEYLELFEEISGSFNSHLTEPLYLAGSPTAPNEAVNKEYVDTLFQNIINPGNGLYGDAVATVIHLRQVDVSLVPDKQIRLVESVNRIYAYDLESTATPDNDYVVQPLAGSGRWLSTEKRIIDGGTF